jgi:hypothetical protein
MSTDIFSSVIICAICEKSNHFNSSCSILLLLPLIFSYAIFPKAAFWFLLGPASKEARQQKGLTQENSAHRFHGGPQIFFHL